MLTMRTGSVLCWDRSERTQLVVKPGSNDTCVLCVECHVLLGRHTGRSVE